MNQDNKLTAEEINFDTVRGEANRTYKEINSFNKDAISWHIWKNAFDRCWVFLSPIYTQQLADANKEIERLQSELTQLKASKEVSDEEVRNKSTEWADEFYEKDSQRSSVIYENIEWENRYYNFLEGAKWMRSHLTPKESDAVEFENNLLNFFTTNRIIPTVINDDVMYKLYSIFKQSKNA